MAMEMKISPVSGLLYKGGRLRLDEMIYQQLKRLQVPLQDRKE